METNGNIMKIKAIMEYYGLTQTAMATRLGIPQTNLSAMLGGKRACGKGIMEKVQLNFPEINIKWLYQDGEQMITPSPAVQQNNVHGDNNYNNGVMQLPACGRAECGAECGRSGSEIIVIEEAQRPIIPSEWACKPDFDVIDEVFKNPDKVDKSRFIVLDNPVDIWIEVRDDSLVPRAYRGDRLGLLVYPKGKEDPIWGKFHAVDTCTNGIVVRKLYPAEGGYRCVSPNEEFPDLFITKENILSVSRVVYVVRKAL